MATAPNKYLSADPATRANPVAAALGIHGVTTSVKKNDNYDRIKRDNAEAIGTYRAGIEALKQQVQGELNTILDALTLTNRQLADLDADIGLKDITTREQFLVNRANRINELKTAYEQHAQQFGAALNDKAIDILQQHSMINAPTLTSIMTGWEMARASQRDNDRARLDNMAKMYEQISQLEDRAMQIEMDAHKANLQHQRNEAEHAKGLLENQLNVLERVLNLSKDAEEKSLNANVTRIGAASTGGGLGGSSPFAGSLADMEAAVGGGQAAQKPAEEKKEEGTQQQQGTQQKQTPARKLTEDMVAKDDVTSQDLSSAIRDYGGFSSEKGSLSRNMRERLLNGETVDTGLGKISYDPDEGRMNFVSNDVFSLETGGMVDVPSSIRLSSTQKKEFEENGKIPKFDSGIYADQNNILSRLYNVNEQNAKEFEKKFGEEYGFDLSNRQSFLGLPDDKKRMVTDVLGITQVDTPVEIEATVR